MKHSIRVRFTLIFIGLTAVVLLAVWGVNNWFLEDFYVLAKVKVLELAYNQVDSIVEESADQGKTISEEFQQSSVQDTEELGTLQHIFRDFGDKANITVVIYDTVTDTAIRPSSRDAEFLFEKVKQYIIGFNSYEPETLREHENYLIQRSYDVRTKSFYLESWGYFSDNRTIFIMSTPLSSIRESVAITNRFLTYVGLLALIASSILMYFATRKVTLPILQLASLSEKMSNLDFEAKYSGQAEDEIGVLGNSMNMLSDRLKETIGELKSANLQLHEDIEEKIQIDEMRKDFIANVSHELKTPIALIQGYAEGLTEGMADEKDSRDYYCSVIIDEANKMNKMVKQLLTLTALEFGNDSTSIEAFDLIELIRGIISSTQILLQQKEGELVLDSPESLLVWADEFKIEEVITNYLSNAFHHLDGERKIKFTVTSDHGTARVSVFNTGSPIPEEDIPNLWTKFYKVDKARTREYGGSGIGLSIVKAIVEAHHKEYGVVNHETGVEFWFTVDCDKIAVRR